jgi:protein TonB
MLNRVLVPADARMSQTEPRAMEDSAAAARIELLVPRHLIPANARMPEYKPAAASADETPSAVQEIAASRTLVPANALLRAAQNVPVAIDLGDLTAAPNLFKLDAALLDEACADGRRKPVDWAISLAVHLAFIAVVMILPLLFTQAINLGQFRNTYLVSPSFDVHAPGPPPPPPAAAIRPPQTPRVQNVTNRLIAPIAIPKTVAMIHNIPEPPSEADAGVPGGVIGGVPGGQIGGVIGSALGGGDLVAPPPPPPSAPAPAAGPSGPLRVGGNVKKPRAIFSPQPDYPRLAQQARVQGVVEIEAVIDENGNVIQTHAMSGSGLLIPAAMVAVAQWKYEPTYLDGKPYPVDLMVTVTFHL